MNRPNQTATADFQSQVIRDLSTVEVVAVVELLEAQVAGNFPIVDVGADVKTEVAIEKRVNTRGEIQLRGIVREFLKGCCMSNLLKKHSTSHLNSFNILTTNLIANRDNIVLETPASNIPDLRIGEEYLILFDPVNPSNLYFTSIWPIGSTEAAFVIDHLKKETSSNSAQ